jgi:lysozyme
MIRVTQKCVDFIKGFEAFRAKPYHGEADAPNIFTIGYGTIKYPPFYLNGKAVALTDPPITEEQATSFLEYEIKHKCEYIDPFLRDDLSDNQFAALVSFVYNLGEGALRYSTLLRKVNSKPSDTAIRDEFMRWVHGEGNAVIPGLVRRRNEEADMYFTI